MLRFPLLIAALSAAPALASEAVPASLSDDSGFEADRGQILVIATRLGGELDVPQPPVATLDQDQIAAYGAASIADLLVALAPQTGSGRGRGGGFPVVLVNGQRIASFREMRNYPPEAIRKVEVLPEEVALRFGFPPDSRVVNFILKDNFVSRSIEAEQRVPTRGGFQERELEGTLLKIDGPNRFSVTGSTDDTSPLFESERGLVQAGTVALGAPNPAAYRTLIADSRNFGFNTSWSRGLGQDGKGGQLSFNANAAHADSRSGSGLDVLLAPLERISRETTVSGSTGYNTNFGDWQFSATADATHGETETLIDRVAGSGFDVALSNTERLTSLITMIGRPLRLPAGKISVTAKAGYNWSNIASSDTRSAPMPVSLTRGRITTGVSISLPLTSRRDQVLGALGDISLNFSAGYDRLSDFGALSDWSAGLIWSPTERLGLQVSYIVVEAAPSLTNLGAPATVTFNVPTFDFSRGETVLATISGGGNRALLRETQRDLKFSGNWQLPFLSNSSLLVEYFRNRSADVTASFPLLTPAIEAAFPGRVTRDAGGRLVAIDRRPITLAQQRGSRLRWGFNLSGAIGKAPEGGGGRPGGGSRPDGAGRPGGGGMGGMGAMFGGQGRWNVGLFHTWRFSEQVLVAPGGPSLDLLSGDALSGGGAVRHAMELESGIFHKGFGVRVVGRYNSATAINGSGLAETSDLRFSGLFGFDLRVYSDLGQQPALTRLSPFFKGARLSLRADNIFDAWQRVTDSNGAVPLSYQRDYIDPRGRVIEIELRKMF